jgi:hypothetical protein
MAILPTQNLNSEILTLLKAGETLTVEFKSDVKGLPDRDIVKRIGLAEPTGRGLDRIYEGMLRSDANDLILHRQTRFH